MTPSSAATVWAVPAAKAKCPCCESEQVSLSFEKDQVNYYACQSCRLTFIFPYPDDKTLQRHYTDYGERYYTLDGLKDFLLSRDHYPSELSLLFRTTNVGALLDVGCSVGGFVRAAGERGYSAEGIDVSATSVAVGQSVGLNVRAGDFLSSSFAIRF